MPRSCVPPVNVLRLSLHPKGIAPRIANYHEWRAHLLARLRHQVDLTADAVLTALLAELAAFPAPASARPVRQIRNGDQSVVVPFQLATDAGLLSFVSTTTVFGTPLEITLSELALEFFFPADAATAAALRLMSEQSAKS